MGIFVPWLADAAKMTGYPVVEEANWRTRGHGGFRVVEGVTGHHTAGPATGEYPCRKVIRDGRAGLRGPLGNFGLGRSGTIYVVAAGVAYHAGVSTFAGFYNLNDEFLGIEAEDDGDGNWTPEQLDAYPRLVAACLHYMKRDESRYAGHKDVAIPIGRKVDPKGIETPWMRSVVRVYLSNPTSIRKGSVIVPQVFTSSVPTRLLVVGTEGEDVKWVQTRLTYWGFPTNVDGDFGPNTESNVKKFQAFKKIEVDGKVGKVTVSYLGQDKPLPTPAKPPSVSPEPVTPTPVKEEPTVTEAEMDRIAEKVFAKLQPKGGEALGSEVDMLRRDMREIAFALNHMLDNLGAVQLKINGARDHVIES